MAGPTLIGAYEVLGELGRGGMGVVLRARGPSGEDVALKVLRSRDPDLVARFERERRLLASFGEAEGFVPLLDAGSAPEGLFFVMPFLGGGTLRDRMRSGPLSVKEVRALGAALATALGRAHARGVVHRDLKPENVLFTLAGTPLVADLGLAKHWRRDVAGGSQSAAISIAGELGGTAGYAAPEQLDAFTEAGPPADVFALGAILFECLAGEPPFVRRSLIAYVAAIKAGPARPIRAVRPSVPRDLGAAIDRALALAPAERPGDGAALARALRPRRRAHRIVAFAALAALLAAAFLGRGAMRSARARELHASGNAHRARKEMVLAEQAFTRALELAPELVEALVDRGEVRARRSDMAGALTDVRRALEIDPENGRAWTGLGAIHLARNELEPATLALDRAVQLIPLDESVRLNRAALLLARHSPTAALEEATRAVDLAPGDAAAWAVKGAALAALGRPDEALACGEKATALDQDCADAWYLRGFARVGTLDLRGAARDFERALRLAPSSDASATARAFLEDEARGAALTAADFLASARRSGESGGYLRALLDATRAIERDPSLAWAWSLRAEIRRKRGEFEAAVADATQAIERDEGLGHAYRVRGVARFQGGGDTDASLADLDRSLALEGRRAATLMNRARVRERRGEWALALADLDEVLAAGPKEVQAILWRAGVHLAAGDGERAAADATAVIALAPRNVDARLCRARARALVNDRKGAREDVEAALVADPGSAEVWEVVGELESDPSKAIVAFTLAVLFDPALGSAWGKRARKRLERGDREGADADRAIEVSLEDPKAPTRASK